MAALGRRRLADIGPVDVRRYLLARQRAGARNATINRELCVLKRAFALAVAAGTLATRPHVPLLREDNVRRGSSPTASRARAAGCRATSRTSSPSST